MGTAQTSLSAKILPSQQTTRLRNAITSYKQMQGESLYVTWERFRDLQRACPHHNMETWQLFQIFHGGLLDDTRNYINGDAGGKLNNMTPQ